LLHVTSAFVLVSASQPTTANLKQVTIQQITNILTDKVQFSKVHISIQIFI